MKEKTKRFILQEARNAGFEGSEETLLSLLDNKVEEPGDEATKEEKEVKERNGRKDIKASVIAVLELCQLFDENIKHYEKISEEDADGQIEAITQYRIWDYKRRMLEGMRLGLTVNDALAGEDREVLIEATKEMMAWFCRQSGADCNRGDKLDNFAPILDFTLEELEDHEYSVFCEGFLASMKVERRKLNEKLNEKLKETKSEKLEKLEEIINEKLMEIITKKRKEIKGDKK